jgi:hypothetical protein
MSRELFQTALEFCHDLLAEWEWKKGERAGLGEEYDELLEFISTLNHEIVKPLPKPVAWMKKHENGVVIFSLNPAEESDFTPLYAEPPARNPLTDDEINRIANSDECYSGKHWEFDTILFARAIEAKIKERE